MKTHYDNLKVSRDAPDEVIKAAYKVLAMKYHPDRNPTSGKTFTIINQAYEVLSDSTKRYEHDVWIDENEPKESVTYSHNIVYKEKIVEKVIYFHSKDEEASIFGHRLFPTHQEEKTIKFWLQYESALLLLVIILDVLSYEIAEFIIRLLGIKGYDTIIAWSIGVIWFYSYVFTNMHHRQTVTAKGAAWFWFIVYNIAVCLLYWRLK